MSDIEIIEAGLEKIKNCKATSKRAVFEVYLKDCAHCQTQLATLRRMKSRNSGVEFYKINAKFNPGVVNRYDIASVPTIIYVSEEGKTKTHTGVMNKKLLERFIEDNPQ